MTKKVAISNELYNKLKMFQIEAERKERRWIPLSKISNVQILPENNIIGEKKKKNGFFDF
jgi:hypothetical protein